MLMFQNKREFRSLLNRSFWTAVACASLCVPLAPLHADRPDLRVISANDLRFGSFAVIGRGYRIVRPSGDVESVGLFSTGGGDTGPARFTVQYDRGNNGRRRLNLKVDLVFSSAPVVTEEGVVARLTSYRTDLPNYPAVSAGQVIQIEIPNCVQRVCSKTFNLGGRLDVTRNYGGALIEVPIPVDAVLTSVR